MVIGPQPVNFFHVLVGLSSVCRGTSDVSLSQKEVVIVLSGSDPKTVTQVYSSQGQGHL